MRTIEDVLGQARRAPSGDNTQPWLVGIVDDRDAIVLGRDARAHYLNDLDGRSILDS